MFSRLKSISGNNNKYLFIPNSILFLLPVLFIINLTACVHTPKTETTVAIFKAETLPDKNLSGLYIYRPPTMTNWLYATKITIDNNVILPIKPGQLKHLNLKPGQHQVNLLTADEFKGKHKLKVILQSNKNYYLRIATTLDLEQNGNYKPYKRSFNLQQVSAITAIAQINKCCYSKIKPGRNKAIARKKNDTQTNKKPAFSVDKTENPFSH